VRVLVFGGTGQIGARVTQALCARGDHVTVVGRRRPQGPLSPYLGDTLQWIEGDVRDADHILRITDSVQPDRVLHLAALLQFACKSDPERATDVNVRGTVNVLNAAQKVRVPRVIFGSSITVYGEREDVLTEDGPIGPGITLYGATKLMGEQLGCQYAENSGMAFVALRYCGIFGAGDPQSRGMAWVRREIERTASGNSVAIEDASGDERAQLTYVQDAADATVLALDHRRPSHQIYNVAAPQSNYVSLREFHEAVKRVVPSAGSVRFGGRGCGMAPVSVERIQRDLGFVGRYSVTDGLRAAVLEEQGALGANR